MLDPAIRWTDRLQSSSGDWTGNLFDFYFRVYAKLVKDLKIPFQLDGITRVDDTLVHKALREALANCLVNTDIFAVWDAQGREEPLVEELYNPDRTVLTLAFSKKQATKTSNRKYTAVK